MEAIMIESTEVINKQGTVFTIGANEMKSLKNMVKGHKKTTIPVLNVLLVKIDDKTMTVTCSNSDTTIVTQLECEVQEMTDIKSFTLPIDIVKKTTNIKGKDVFTFELLNKNEIVMKRNSIKKKLNTIDPEEYPRLPKNIVFHDVPLKVGRESLVYDDILEFEKAALSTATFETRPILQGLCLREGKMVATDSHRLYVADSPLEQIKSDIVIMSSAIKIFKNVFKKSDQIKLSVSDNLIKMTSEKTTVLSRMIEGKFPKIENMIPTQYKVEFSIDDVTKFKDVLTDCNKAMVNLTVKKNGLAEIKTIKTEEFDIEATLDITQPIFNNGEEFKITFNPKNVLDVIKQFDERRITLKFTGNMSPFVIVPDNRKNSELALLSPVRTY